MSCQLQVEIGSLPARGNVAGDLANNSFDRFNPQPSTLNR